MNLDGSNITVVVSTVTGCQPKKPSMRREAKQAYSISSPRESVVVDSLAFVRSSASRSSSGKLGSGVAFSFSVSSRIKLELVDVV